MLYNSFVSSIGFGKTHHCFKVMFVSLFLLHIAATTLMIIT
jgi:hypothetical protein